MKPKKILITGVAGFIGSNLAKALLDDGHHIIGGDNFSQGNNLNLKTIQEHPQFTICDLDVRNLDEMKRAAEGCDVIYHLAAFKIPRYGNAFDTLDVNSRGTSHAVEAALAHNAQLIFSSTSDVYGRNPHIPFTEQHDLVIGSPDVRRWAYAISKAYSEQVLFAEKERRNLNFTIVRFFGGYGPHQNLTWWGGPQSVFIGKALDNESIPIHGDGLQTRSFTFVEDHVTGLQACLDNPKALGEVFNLGSTEEITILDLAKKIWSFVRDDEPKIELIPYETFGKYTDVRRRVPDLTKSKEILGYTPKWKLDDGLNLTIEWQKKRRAEIQALEEAERKSA